jgi:hypothetical protein
MRAAARERMISIMAQGLAWWQSCFSASLVRLPLVQLQARKEATRRLTASEFITRFMEPRARRIRLLCCCMAAETR